MANTGNFAKSYIKQVSVKDLDGQSVEILLKYTARTPLLYMNMFGTDMFDDLAEVVIQLDKRDDIVKKIDESGAEKLTESDLKGLDMTLMFDFFNKFAASLVATAHYPKPLPYDVIAETMLPADFITDAEYANLFEAIKELFIPAVDDYKKKLMQVAAGINKKI